MTHGHKNFWRIMPAAVAMALLMLLSGPPMAAAEIAVDATLTPQTLTLGESALYQIRISSNNERLESHQVRFIGKPEFEGFQVQAGSPNTFSKQTIINGRRSDTLEFRWNLIAVQEGEVGVGGLEVRYENRTYSVEAVKAQVVRGEAPGTGLQGLPEGTLPPQTGNANLDRQLRGQLFARLELSRTDPWLQDAVELEVRIYADPSIASALGNVRWTPPPWADFVAQEEPQGELHFTPETFQGKRYQVVTVARYRVSPSRSGLLEIPLSHASCTLRILGRSSFEDRFFGDSLFGSPFSRSVPVRLPIEPLRLDVRPLPSEGRPASFNGAIGEFAAVGSIDRHRITQDDLLALRIEVGGDGYLGSITRPNLPDLDGWTEAGLDERTESVGDLTFFRGKKVFQVLLRPERTGNLAIPAFPVSFFIPSEGRYFESQIGPFQVEVAPGTARSLVVSGAAASPGVIEPEPRVLAERLAYIRSDFPPRMAAGRGLHLRPGFLWLQAVPLLLLALSIAFRLRRDYLERHGEKLRYRAAGARARRELREARAAFQRGDSAAFHAALAEALRRYAATKLGRSALGLTIEELQSACANRGIDPSDAQALRQVLEKCDAARYLPVPAAVGEMESVLDECGELLERIDKRWR